MQFTTTAAALSTSASHQAALLFASALLDYAHDVELGELTGLPDWEFASDVLDREFPWSYRLFGDADAGYVLQADDDERYAYVAIGVVSTTVWTLDPSDERDADSIARASEFFATQYAECVA